MLVDGEFLVRGKRERKEESREREEWRKDDEREEGREREGRGAADGLSWWHKQKLVGAYAGLVTWVVLCPGEERGEEESRRDCAFVSCDADVGEEGEKTLREGE